MRRRKFRAARRLLGLAGFSNQVGEEAERTENGVAVVLLRRIPVDGEEIVGCQVEEAASLLIQRLADFLARQLDVFESIGQPLGPRLDGCCHWVCLAVRRVRIARSRCP